MEQSVARRAHNPEAAGSSPAPATTKKAPILGLFPFPSYVQITHFRGLTTKLRHFEITALGMIVPPFRFLDEYAETIAAHHFRCAAFLLIEHLFNI